MMVMMEEEEEENQQPKENEEGGDGTKKRHVLCGVDYTSCGRKNKNLCIFLHPTWN